MERRTSLAAMLGIASALTLWLIIVIQLPAPSGGFSIILTLNNTELVSEADVVRYNATSHEFTLTRECAERLDHMGWRLAGDFTIVVDGEVELSGLFVPPIISRSYPSSQVVIVYPNIWNSDSTNYGVMKVQMGYPWDLPVAGDPRDNPRISGYFEGLGRLVR
jgi:hypothetical protein